MLKNMSTLKTLPAIMNSEVFERFFQLAATNCSYILLNYFVFLKTTQALLQFVSIEYDVDNENRVIRLVFPYPRCWLAVGAVLSSL